MSENKGRGQNVVGGGLQTSVNPVAVYPYKDRVGYKKESV